MSVFDPTTETVIKAFAARYATYIYGTTGCEKSANVIGHKLDENIGAGKDDLIKRLYANGHTASSWPEARALVLSTLASLEGWTT
jgi:hypothetical protein